MGVEPIVSPVPRGCIPTSTCPASTRSLSRRASGIRTHKRGTLAPRKPVPTGRVCPFRHGCQLKLPARCYLRGVEGESRTRYRAFCRRAADRWRSPTLSSAPTTSTVVVVGAVFRADTALLAVAGCLRLVDVLVQRSVFSVVSRVCALGKAQVAQVCRVSVGHLVRHAVDVLDICDRPTIDALACFFADDAPERRQTNSHLCK